MRTASIISMRPTRANIMETDGGSNPNCWGESMRCWWLCVAFLKGWYLVGCDANIFQHPHTIETVSAAFDEIHIYQSSMGFLEFVYELRLLTRLSCDTMMRSVIVYLLWQSYRIKKWASFKMHVVIIKQQFWKDINKPLLIIIKLPTWVSTVKYFYI